MRNWQWRFAHLQNAAHVLGPFWWQRFAEVTNTTDCKVLLHVKTGRGGREKATDSTATKHTGNQHRPQFATEMKHNKT